MSAEQIGMDVSFDQEQRAVQSAGDTGNDGGGDGGGYELDENGQRVPHGMGQSKSSRRRRRKRKMKVGETAGAGESSDQEGDDSSSPSSSSEEVVALVQAAGSATPAAPRTQQGSGRNAANGAQSFNGQNGNGMANGSNGGQNVAPGGTKRWKKKFRERDRPRAAGENPGNQTGGSGFRENTGSGRESNGFSGPSASNGGGFSGGQFRGPDTHQPGNGGGGGFKRKGGFGSGSGGSKQGRSGGGARGGFVGPMDHSYRAVNGNFSDTPPSTMDPYSGGGRRGGYSGDSQPIDYSQGRAIPIAADAPTHIYFFIEDLFITAKIQETARKLGVKVAFVKNDKESIAQLMGGEDNDRPSLIVFDLNNANAKPMTLMPKLKAKLKKSVSIVGFLSHLQGDLKAKAMESGCDTVMPRAAFSQNLPNLLRRYGIEDTEEVANYNQ